MTDLETSDPDDPSAHFERANAQFNHGHSELALVSYNRAIELRPDYAEAYNNRGNALRGLGRYAAALANYDRAIALKPNFVEAHYNRGRTSRDLGRPEEAVLAYDRAIALKPDLTAAHVNRGNALRDLDRPEEALASYEAAIALNPNHARAHYGRGAVSWELGRPAEALSSYDRALALEPDLVEARYNKGLCHLAMGDYERGWDGFEWRWKSRYVASRSDLPGAPWLGEYPIQNKIILVHAEQGFGDTLQLCRYVPVLAAQARVVLQVPRPLLRLLSGLAGVAQIVENDDPLPRFDAWIPMMSLPLALRSVIDTIPSTIPYLSADPERMAAWRQRLSVLPGRKIGLVWAGSPLRGSPRAEAMDRRRSMTLERFAPLTSVPGLSLISLQKGEPAAQARTPPTGMTLHDWTNELDDYADTAALVEALDLVISVDTSVVHLAGALGKPVWVLNRYDQCWRWLLDRTDSPWYPTARLFRQPSAGDWSAVIRDVVHALRAGD
jgi:Tfp pilus assembly protein PilF